MKNSVLPHNKEEPCTILVADDDKINQTVLKSFISAMGHIPALVDNGQAVLDYCDRRHPDVILLDMMMPKMNGMAVLKELRIKGLLDRIPVIVVSGVEKRDNIAVCIRLGAKDYMTKPFDPVLLKARIQACIERKRFHDNESKYYDLVEDFNDILEKRVQQQVRDITESHVAAIFAMSKLAESRDNETGEHLERMREYSKILCFELQKKKKYKFEITDSFIDDIYIASPLHDIGKIGIPDRVLQKNGKLTDGEWSIMKTHTTIGAETLRDVNQKHAANNLIRLGIEIAENHHEKWNGSGYPNGRKEDEIPLSARIVTLADVYDALTSERCYKKAFDHEKASKIILNDSGTHFDSDVVEAFIKVESQFYSIKNRLKNPE